MAKERLRLVLINDRTGLSPRMLDELRIEITKVISKYLEIDESALDIQMTNVQSEDGTTPLPTLIANIPIKKVKGRETTRQGL
jgi:cell division topological specificity factor